MIMNFGYLKVLTVILGMSVIYFGWSSGLSADKTLESERQTTFKTSMALHGTTKYGAQNKPFRYFDYVNPNAPKFGSVSMAANGSFDSLNPYINKGTPVVGIGLIYDTLMTQSKDEPFSLYPLVAESVEVDQKSIIFNLNSAAHFHDGKRVTADDVKYSFELLTTVGHPFYRSYYSDIDTVTVLSDRRVKFTFKNTNNRELPFIISELPVLPKHFWEKSENNFNSDALKLPLGSGPYQISKVDPGRSISYERVKDYWAKDLPVNVGHYNFDKVNYDYFRDEHVALEALKAGKYDIRFEYIAKNWATAYDVPAVHNGDLVMATIPNKNPAVIQGFAFNLRRDFFNNRFVRKAIGYAMDFEWLNRNLFFDSYIRSTSYFGNSGMEATGLPDKDELKLLQPWRTQLPEELFTQPYQVSVTDGSGYIRPQLKEALTLLKKAGWHMEDNKLVDENRQPMKIELLLNQPTIERIALPFKKNLEQIGIELNIRTVDNSQYINRLRDFDFDMIVAGYGQSASPGNEQSSFWGSAAADIKGSRNYMGIKNPVVDAMIDQIIDADSREKLMISVKALDRVLLWGEYMILHWYFPYDRVAHSSRVIRPKTEPLYSNDVFTWWIDDRLDDKRKDNHLVTTDETIKTTTIKTKSMSLWFFCFLLILGLISVWIYRRRKKV